MATRLIERDAVLNVEEIAELGLRNTGAKFADLPIFTDDSHGYLMQKLNEKSFRVYFKYKA